MLIRIDWWDDRGISRKAFKRHKLTRQDEAVQQYEDIPQRVESDVKKRKRTFILWLDEPAAKHDKTDGGHIFAIHGLSEAEKLPQDLVTRLNLPSHAFQWGLYKWDSEPICYCQAKREGHEVHIMSAKDASKHGST